MAEPLLSYLPLDKPKSNSGPTGILLVHSDNHLLPIVVRNYLNNTTIFVFVMKISHPICNGHLTYVFVNVET